jgi:hypothetical protein
VTKATATCHPGTAFRVIAAPERESVPGRKYGIACPKVWNPLFALVHA